jgi:hypothetical protein
MPLPLAAAAVGKIAGTAISGISEARKHRQNVRESNRGSGAGAGDGGASGASGFMDSLKGLAGKMNTTPVNAGLAGVGLVKTMIGKSKEKKADAMLPQNEDPEIRSMQRHFARRKRAFQTGTASNAKRNTLKSIAAGGAKAAFRLGGGTQGLNRMTQMFNQGIQGLNQDDLKGELEFGKMESSALTRIAQRKIDLGMQRHDIAQARAAQTLKEGKSTMNLGIARSVPLGEPNAAVGGDTGNTRTLADRLYGDNKKVSVGTQDEGVAGTYSDQETDYSWLRQKK